MKINAPVALVTGGRRGIGRGIVWRLADEGFDIVINDLFDDDAMRETIDGVEARGRKCAIALGDIAALDQQDDFVNRAWQAFGRIDTLVNNAGVSVLSRGDLLDVSVESYDRNLDVNLRGPFFLTQRFARRMMDIPDPEHYRSIVCISSTSADTVSINRGEYCISKAGLSMMVRLFATRLAAHGIAVHEIRPGIIRTDMTAVSAANFDERIREGLTPIRRWGTPDDIGSAVAALAVGTFSFSTGSAFELDGGMHINRF
ncbi:3-ketoacyl-ACP reductase [Paraburkholderia fynbosensis]|uniref:3-oxoacyl-[acyl-carrier-protein] reductase FabG n=1 Tax=Paraburkholderia fynbosensis TaxID=1200993 RepID=A0A6J5H1H0_9BURK|nr:3-ketoacyl-ACP reductase [Paraburkholderia fynbosensis]CAB3810022.1 3-oxoacyl-[acyl-carrier-protein] reductase FabG [Paraburkholderia fynbosensis]